MSHQHQIVLVCLLTVPWPSPACSEQQHPQHPQLLVVLVLVVVLAVKAAVKAAVQ
jgi:hypothetical protein